MTRLNSVGKLVGLVLLSLSAVGCCTKEKQQIETLKAQYNDLSVQNQDLRSELAQCQSREAELQEQLRMKNADLSAAQAQMSSLRQQVSQRPAPTQREWEIGLKADRVTVGSDILFPSGKAELTRQGKARLDQIAADLKSQYSGMPVRVYGYTDNDPIRKSKNLWQDNLDLSANRAMAVTRYLRDRGIDAEEIETVAMGATHFVAPNNTKATKARNRRVEIIVIKQ
jgi:flagellar motor protein MotB